MPTQYLKQVKVNKTSYEFEDLEATAFIDTKGKANGLATLNAAGKVPDYQLPNITYPKVHPSKDGTAGFSTGEAYDFFDGCITSNEWLTRVFGLSINNLIIKRPSSAITECWVYNNKFFILDSNKLYVGSNLSALTMTYNGQILQLYYFPTNNSEYKYIAIVRNGLIVSADGLLWESLSLPISGVTYTYEATILKTGSTYLFYQPHNGNILSSTNLVTWTKIYSTSSYVSDVDYRDGIIMYSCGVNSLYYTSDNFATTHFIFQFPTEYQPITITHTDNYWYISNGSKVYYSNTPTKLVDYFQPKLVDIPTTVCGLTFDVAMITHLSSFSRISNITKFGQIYFAMLTYYDREEEDDIYRLIYSFDELSWYSTEIESEYPLSVSSLNGYLYANSEDGLLYKSINGLNWTFLSEWAEHLVYINRQFYITNSSGLCLVE